MDIAFVVVVAVVDDDDVDIAAVRDGAEVVDKADDVVDDDDG